MRPGFGRRRLDEVFIPVSDFRITPWSRSLAPAACSRANPAEVARILTPPRRAFLPGAPVEIVERAIGDWPLRYGGYRIDGLHVWGATARILGQLGPCSRDRLTGAPRTGSVRASEGRAPGGGRGGGTSRSRSLRRRPTGRWR